MRKGDDALDRAVEVLHQLLGRHLDVLHHRCDLVRVGVLHQAPQLLHRLGELAALYLAHQRLYLLELLADLGRGHPVRLEPVERLVELRGRLVELFPEILLHLQQLARLGAAAPVHLALGAYLLGEVGHALLYLAALLEDLLHVLLLDLLAAARVGV